MSFRVGELRELVISWIVLSFCFIFTYDLKALIGRFPIALLTVGAGFVVHELSHKYVAQKMGCLAYYKMWGWGLLLAIFTALISGGRFIFAAPGAVYISYPVIVYGFSERHVKKSEGKIALSGPIANLTLALIFYALGSLEGILGLIGSIGFSVNAFLAFFNLLPFPPLDGWKVFRYNKLIWALTIGLSAVLSFY